MNKNVQSFSVSFVYISTLLTGDMDVDAALPAEGGVNQLTNHLSAK